MQMNTGGKTQPGGEMRPTLVRDLGDLRMAPASWRLKNWIQHRRHEAPRNVAAAFLGRVGGVLTVKSELRGVVYRRNPNLAPWQNFQLDELLKSNHDLRFLPAMFGGQVTDYGLLSSKLVTDAGVQALVDGFQALFTISNFKYHGFGTGTTAESASQTALVTELTTQYATDSTRPTGSQTEGAANVYRSVATLSPDTGGTIAITEHGLFSATSAGTLWDRSVFSAVNLVAGSDSLQATYDGTFASGG